MHRTTARHPTRGPRRQVVHAPPRTLFVVARGERTIGARVRPITKLLAICLVAGVIVAGITFPFAGGVGLLSNDASDTVNATSSDLAAGQLPGVTTVTDNKGA